MLGEQTQEMALANPEFGGKCPDRRTFAVQCTPRN
jgi:hypothetical protein